MARGINVVGFSAINMDWERAKRKGLVLEPTFSEALGLPSLDRFECELSQQVVKYGFYKNYCIGEIR